MEKQTASAPKNVKKTNTGAKKAEKTTAKVQDAGAQVANAAEELVEDVVEAGKKVREMTAGVVKETAEKIDFSNSVNKIKSTAKNVNAQLKETATEVMEDVKENGKELRTAAAKLAKNVNAQLKETATEVLEDVKENGKELRTAATKLAKNVNAQLKETTTEVVEDVKENGKELRATVKKLAKEAVDNIHLTERLNQLKKAAQKTNNYALETADTLVDTVAANSEKWHKVAEKAVKTGLKMADKQQELVFSTLEAVKGQLGGSAKRLKKLFTNN